MADFGGLNSGNTTEFVAADGGCPGTSAALVNDVIGATKSVLKTAIWVYAFMLISVRQAIPLCGEDEKATGQKPKREEHGYSSFGSFHW
jgi:hypothetical protein